MKEQVKILGIPFDDVDMEDAVEMGKKYAIGDRLRSIFTPNPEIVMIAQKDDELKRALNSADMLVADGIGIIIASILYGNKLPERVAGFDLVSELIMWGAHKGWTFYLLGGKPGIADKAKYKLEKAYPNIKIVGVHHGYFRDEEEEVIAHINLCNPNILLVGMGAPLQEKWIFRNRWKLNANLAMGIGGSLDIISGKVRRAPNVFIKLGLEWLYRLFQEPRRIKRMMAIPLFLIKVLLETKLKGLPKIKK